jgi:methylphosphotriester-DNA--protein-cysteine methyltransferase
MFFNDQAPGFSSKYPCIGTRVLCTILQLVLFPTSFIAYSFMAKSDRDRHAKIYLNMSPATLTRRLKAEETTYQKEKDRVRFSRTEQLLLTTDYALQDIADKVGFDNPASYPTRLRLDTV